ncbi:MAG: hypothetical protein JXB32_21330 [Deltaproteobacteria bacterium]|nr:hypothetical protein [Deltaproteobacteria bacterium]
MHERLVWGLVIAALAGGLGWSARGCTADPADLRPDAGEETLPDAEDSTEPNADDSTEPDAAGDEGCYHPWGDGGPTYPWIEFYDGCDPRPELEECSAEHVTCDWSDGPGHDVPLGTSTDAGGAVEFDATWVGVEGDGPRPTTLVLSEGGRERRILVRADARPLAAVLAPDEAVHVAASEDGFALTRAAGGELLLVVVSPASSPYGGVAEWETPAPLGATLEKVAQCDRLAAVPACPPQVVRLYALRATGPAGSVAVAPQATERLETSTGTFEVFNERIDELGPTPCGCAIGRSPNVRFSAVRVE